MSPTPRHHAAPMGEWHDKTQQNRGFVAVPPANPGLICLISVRKAAFGADAPPPAAPAPLRYPSHTPPDPHRRFKLNLRCGSGGVTERLRRDGFGATEVKAQGRSGREPRPNLCQSLGLARHAYSHSTSVGNR